MGPAVSIWVSQKPSLPRAARVAVASWAQDKVDAAVEKLSGYGGKAIGFSADVRDVEVVKAAMLAV